MMLVSDTYQSRVDNETAIVLRQDPVIYSDPRPEVPHGLSHHQLKSYQKNGFILLKGLLSEQEAALFLREARKMAVDPKIRSREEAITEPGRREARSIFMAHRLSALYRQLVADVRLLNIARQILGSEVYIHQSRVNVKSGFHGRKNFWHSDFETWHVEDGMPRMRAASCLVMLTECNEFNGPLMFIPGSHTQYVSCIGETPEDNYKHLLKKQECGIADPVALSFLAERGGIQSMKGPAGSVVFFDCNTMHGANSNISPYPRASLFFVYNSVENTLENPRGSLKPRPEFIATRQDFSPIVPMQSVYGESR